MSDNPFPDPVPLPITDELDLHVFQPRDVASLLPDYLEECLGQGILVVRVIHGKGSGALRAGVHAILERLPMVDSWSWPAGGQSGGWGATWVYLKPSKASDTGECTAGSEAAGSSGTSV